MKCIQLVRATLLDDWQELILDIRNELNGEDSIYSKYQLGKPKKQGLKQQRYVCVRRGTI